MLATEINTMIKTPAFTPLNPLQSGLALKFFSRSLNHPQIASSPLLAGVQEIPLSM